MRQPNRFTTQLLCATALGLSFALVACGGGGGTPTISPPAPPPPPPPPPPPLPNTVVFTGDDGVTGIRLYAVEDDGTGHRSLSVALGSQQRGLIPFKVSPDENWVGFIGNPEGANQLYVNEISGGTALRVNRVEQNGGITTSVKSFDWSPDSNQLAFTANLDLESQVELYVINRDGTGLISVSDGVSNEQVTTEFEWSPDGTQIAFSAGTSPFTPTAVYIAEADGSGITRISDPLVSDIGQIEYVSN